MPRLAQDAGGGHVQVSQGAQGCWRDSSTATVVLTLAQVLGLHKSLGFVHNAQDDTPPHQSECTRGSTDARSGSLSLSITAGLALGRAQQAAERSMPL